MDRGERKGTRRVGSRAGEGRLWRLCSLGEDGIRGMVDWGGWGSIYLIGILAKRDGETLGWEWNLVATYMEPLRN